MCFENQNIIFTQPNQWKIIKSEMSSIRSNQQYNTILVWKSDIKIDQFSVQIYGVAMAIGKRLTVDSHTVDFSTMSYL